MRAEIQWNRSRVNPWAPDHTETESSMMFIMAKPATAIACSICRDSCCVPSVMSPVMGTASNPISPRIFKSCGNVISGKCVIATRFAVKFTRAAAMPGFSAKPFSILEMHPAQRILGTANSVWGSATGLWFGVAAVTAMAPSDERCPHFYEARAAHSTALAAKPLWIAIGHHRQRRT